MADLMKVAHEAKELLEAEGVYCELAVSDQRSCGGQIVFSCVLGWDYFKKKGWAKTRRVIDAVFQGHQGQAWGWVLGKRVRGLLQRR